MTDKFKQPTSFRFKSKQICKQLVLANVPVKEVLEADISLRQIITLNVPLRQIVNAKIPADRLSEYICVKINTRYVKSLTKL